MEPDEQKQHFSNSHHPSKAAISENLADLMLAVWTLALIVVLPMLVPMAFVGVLLAVSLLITHFLFLRT
jgi:type III secretory pathway component EscV